MKRKVVIIALCLLSTAMLAQIDVATSNEGPSTRSLQGTVLTKGDVPLSDAVVYLKNRKTLDIRTYISDKDGNYRFTSLSPNIDYEIYAEYKGKKSDTKTLSSFDS